ncbi:hypothetical protein L6452_41948 [Arctium lappa]|uniref:Uncharacterized protein n=1 Tax=Arctium lappa TaxID=4217 RepID=A0ACB8XHG7_ARCLA|nr:hypothetical protein L6452_41948 [Arctium lappa]
MGCMWVSIEGVVIVVAIKFLGITRLQVEGSGRGKGEKNDTWQHDWWCSLDLYEEDDRGRNGIVYDDPGSSSFSSPIHLDPSEPMDTAFEQDDLLDEEDVIEVDSDEGATARFLTRDPMPSQVDPVPTPEPERMDSTPSLVS